MLSRCSQFQQKHILRKYIMNFKTLLMILLGGGVFIIACQNANKDANQDTTDDSTIEKSVVTDTSSLIGSWEDQSEKALHFTLNADGTAQSVPAMERKGQPTFLSSEKCWQ